MAGRLRFLSERESIRLTGAGGLTLDLHTMKRVRAAEHWRAGRVADALQFADLQCMRCNHVDEARGLTRHDASLLCPKCKAPYWDLERFAAALVIYEVTKDATKYLETINGT